MTSGRGGAGAAEARRALDRLRALKSMPAERAAFAASLLAPEQPLELLLAALEALPAPAPAELHGPLVEVYRHAAAAPAKRDRGGFLRAAALRALGPLAWSEDSDLFDRAALTYEKTYQDEWGPQVLRSAGLAALHGVDPARASLRALELLADRAGTAEGTGEPAVTAVRVLFATGNENALAAYVLAVPGAHPEVVAECLRSLVAMPSWFLLEVVARFMPPPSATVAVGLCDLAIGATLDGLAGRLLRETEPEVAGYLAAAIAASRNATLIAALAAAAIDERDRRRLPYLVDALEWVATEPVAAEALERARQKLGPRRGPAAPEG